ncbi:EF-hand domain-containing protein, partial [bacterium]|nr:EF-hand domain-containing protein [bacterium]
FGILLLAVCVGAAYVLTSKDKIDTNKDGKIDGEELKAAAQPVVEKVVEKVEEAAKPLDLNQDGKVDLADAKEAVKRGKAKVEEVKTEVKKRTGRKPSAKA